jgi:uridine phosphorylase
MNNDQVYIPRGEISPPNDSDTPSAPQQELDVAAIEAAQYPALYIAARNALAQCVEIDEVEQITNKWTALATYAKQMHDTELLDLARRIGIRAERRVGELMNELRGDGAKGTGPWSVAAKHGISKEVTARALRFASVPSEIIEEIIGPPNVPSKTYVAKKLASVRPSPVKNLPKRVGVEQRRVVLDHLRDFYQFWSAQDVAVLQKLFSNPEAKSAAISMAEKIGAQLTAFKKVRKSQAAAVTLIQTLENQLKQYHKKPDKKSTDALVEALENKMREFQKTLKAA